MDVSRWPGRASASAVTCGLGAGTQADKEQGRDDGDQPTTICHLLDVTVNEQRSNAVAVFYSLVFYLGVGLLSPDTTASTSGVDSVGVTPPPKKKQS